MGIFFTLLSFLAAVASVLFGVLVLMKDNKSQLSRVFALLCASMAFWAFAEFQMRFADTYDRAYFWIRANGFWPFSIILLFHFILIFTKQEWLLRRKITYFLLYGYAVAFTFIDMTTEKFSVGPVKASWGWTYNQPQTLLNDIKSVSIVVIGITAAVFALRFYMKQDEPAEKKQAGLVVTGLAIPLVVGLVGEVLFPLLQIRMPEMTDVAFAMGTGGLIGYAIWRYNLFALTPAGAAEEIISTMSDCLLIVSPKGNILNANNAALQLLGFEENELVGSQAETILAEDWFKQALGQGEVGSEHNNDPVSDAETFILAKDRRRIPVSLASSELRDKDGRLLGSIIIARDISERKQAEEEILSQSVKLRFANKELRALYRISAEISQTMNLEEVLSRALAAITSMDLFDIEHKGGIFIREGRNLRLAANMGHPNDFLAAHKDMTLDDCLCGLAARTGKLIVSTHSCSDERHQIRYRGMTDHGHIIIPLKTADHIVGVMYLYLPVGAEISGSQRNLLLTIGNQLSVSIENARLFEETKSLSLHDSLTGLANRNLMQMELARAFARAQRSESPVSLIMLDLDWFKSYNDTYGHASGDRLLIDIASLISNEIRDVDLAARYGGEEFLIILSDTNMDQAVEVAERIRKVIDETGFLRTEGTRPTHMTVSQGIATYNNGVATPELLVAMADASLYQAKDRGRNRVEVFTPNRLHARD